MEDEEELESLRRKKLEELQLQAQQQEAFETGGLVKVGEHEHVGSHRVDVRPEILQFDPEWLEWQRGNYPWARESNLRDVQGWIKGGRVGVAPWATPPPGWGKKFVAPPSPGPGWGALGNAVSSGAWGAAIAGLI